MAYYELDKLPTFDGKALQSSSHAKCWLKLASGKIVVSIRAFNKFITLDGTQ
jgi:hypothetical protein